MLFTSSSRALALLVVSFSACLALDASQIVIVILSQENAHHADLAQKLKIGVLEQAAKLKKIPHIYIVPRDLNYIGGWTVIPLLPQLKLLHSGTALWFFFCEDLTVINLNNLVNGLSKYNPKKSLWMGYAQVDQEPSIIHHFAFAENPKSFKYPLFRAGFAMTSVFLNKLPVVGSEVRSEFSIDPSHELAMYFGVNSPLRNESILFCGKKGRGCGSYPSAQAPCAPPLAKEELYFAVKTCEKYHDTRVPFVQRTWGADAKYLEFFSDVHNKSIPTTGVGINNTERGHCAKTMKILKLSLLRISNHYRHVRWVILTDDDTILGVERLLSLLACFQTDAVVGERYGYKVRGPGMGYNYPTGGGGIAFGVDTLADIVQSCHCPAKDSPDDMILGMCLSSLGIPLIHSPLFHQARPADYADSYLQVERPISFHKHWNIDPLTVYQKWFTDHDHKFAHNEL
ncbi:UDP-glucose O-linked fucose beta-1,3-glucosyltransferase [Nesidiocoris tenuis]|uniref:UDP-glucose O-linked fucose beta-1,3-glucosyltransferase n=1 Tax=Nesidiocoris tenuis TaxID=355587 RepID=A0ABN7AYR6_9HEMI|nr:UDP-glucose O-linked fucose beta-1,3-glucosyltransferase [Nesidiocoris tenuis]